VVKVISTSDDAESTGSDAKAVNETDHVGQPAAGPDPPLQVVLAHDSRKGAVRAVAVSAGSWWVGVGRDDGTIDVFDLDKREIVHSRQLSDPVTAIAFSADGRWLAAASGKLDSRQAKVFLWSVVTQNNRPITPQFAGGPSNAEWNVNSGQVHSLTLSPDGNVLVAGAGDQQAGELIVWKTQDFQEKSRYPGFTGGVRLLSIAPDNSTTLAGSFDGSSQMVDLKAGKVFGKLNFAMTFLQEKDQTPPHLVQALAYLTEDRGLLATGDARGLVSVLEFPRVVERLSFKAHLDTAIQALAFSPDASLLATAGRGEASVRVWNIAQKIR
jgi:WD40 repeat protein